MRHRNKVKKLGKTASHRKAMLENMAGALIENRQIRTTLAKAKALQSFTDKLITYGKTDTVHARRLAFRLLQNRTLVKTLFDEIAPTFSDRKGGYTRIIKLGQRRGDGAEMAMLQLVGFEPLKVEEEAPKKKQKAAKPAKEKAAKEKTKKSAAPAEDKAEETAKAKPKKKPAKKAKDSAETETEAKPKKKTTAKKKTAEETKAAKAAEPEDAGDAGEAKADDTEAGSGDSEK